MIWLGVRLTLFLTSLEAKLAIRIFENPRTVDFTRRHLPWSGMNTLSDS